jgi:cysteine-rich repeat protein
MKRYAIVVVVGWGGCVQSSTLTCPGGTVCPAGTTCETAAGEEWCVTPDRITACEEMADGVGCSFSGAQGTCFDGICLPAECGNLRVDVGEQCDDANHDDGDGCSPDCRSNETCGNGIIDQVRGEQCDDGNHVTHDRCSSGCRVESPLWEAIDATAPAPRWGAAMIYDAARDRVLMFGGGQSTAFNELWQWNGSGWSLIPTLVSPPARRMHAFAYDASTHVAVLFGGTGEAAFTGGSSAIPTNQEFNDTWLWDGTQWSLAAAEQPPPPRQGASAVYDRGRGRVVLYGGQTTLGIQGLRPDLGAHQRRVAGQDACIVARATPWRGDGVRCGPRQDRDVRRRGRK